MKHFIEDCLDKQEHLLISIVWIGHVLHPEFEPHLKIIKEKCGSVSSLQFPQFELNHLGEPMCINEYASRIAAGGNTYVLQIDVPQMESEIAENHVQPIDI